MYTKFNVSILLACFAYSPLAVRIGTRQEGEAPLIAGADVEETSGIAEEEPVTDSLTEMVEEEVVEEVMEDDADPQTLLNEFDDEAQPHGDSATDSALPATEDDEEDGEEEDGSCGGGCCLPTCCEDEKDDTVNLPEGVYVDGRIEQEAYALVDPLEPLIVDLTLEDLDLDLLDAASLEQDVLLPAMQAAIEKMIEQDPSLAEGLPPLPTQLESAVDAVMSIVNDNNQGLEFADIEGSETSQWSTGGMIKDVDELLSAFSFAEYSPSVFWIQNNECRAEGNSCNNLSDRNQQWKELQRKAIGTIFYKVNVDEVPEVNDFQMADGAPSFLATYGGENFFKGKIGPNGWVDFEAEVTKMNKEVNDDVAADDDWTRTAESTFDMSTEDKIDVKDMTDEQIDEEISNLA